MEATKPSNPTVTCGVRTGSELPKNSLPKTGCYLTCVALPENTLVSGLRSLGEKSLSTRIFDGNNQQQLFTIIAS
jgi:hypothetical protein